MRTQATDKRPVIWRPNEGPQETFLACPAREVLYAGSVGSGKSDALLMCAVSQTANPLHRALILRRTFPMLRDMIGRSHELFLPLGAHFNKQESQWHFPSGAICEFGFLDADDDRFRYLGRAFSFIAWDELTSWPGDATDDFGAPVNSSYVYLLSRLRAVAGSNLRLEVRATCTPGGVGHAWVKARWNIPNDGSSCETIDKATGYRRVFIRATISDNPFLADTEYARSLQALPEATRKALLLGRWDVFEGAVFSEWDASIHTCAPFEVPSEWHMWRGADDGYASPCCVLWLAHDQIHDRIFVVQELYERGLTPEVMASAVLQMDEQFGGGLDGIIDSASFADIGLTGYTGRGGGRADIMNRLGCKWKPSEKGAGSRVAGVSQIHARLALDGDGWPGIVIFRNCKNLVRTLPALCYSKRNPEDVDENMETHACDGLRYGLSRKPRGFRRLRLTGI